MRKAKLKNIDSTYDSWYISNNNPVILPGGGKWFPLEGSGLYDCTTGKFQTTEGCYKNEIYTHVDETDVEYLD